MQSDELQQFLLCQEGNFHFALPRQQVGNLLPIPDYMTLPLMQKHMRGVFIHQQKLVVVISVLEKFFPGKVPPPPSVILLAEVQGDFIGLELSKAIYISGVLKEDQKYVFDTLPVHQYCLWKGKSIAVLDMKILSV